MSKLDPETGVGMTMGALYWQLNDVWPGASWSSLEFGGELQPVFQVILLGIVCWLRNDLQNDLVKLCVN